MNRLAIFLVFLVPFVLSDNVVSATYNLQEDVHVFDRTSFATVNVRFDEEVFILDSYQCPSSNDPSFTCAYPANQCPPCDYASQSACGTPMWISSNASCTCEPKYCDNTTYSWTELKMGAETGQTLVYYFAVDFYRVAIDSNCSAIKLETKVYLSDVDVYASWDPLDNTNFYGAPFRAEGYAGGNINICPTHDGYPLTSAGAGTLFIAVYMYGSNFYSGYDLKITSVNALDITPSPIVSNNCNSRSVSIGCVAENYTINVLSNGNPDFYTFDVPTGTCSTLFGRANGGYGTALLYVSSNTSLLNDPNIGTTFFGSVNWHSTFATWENTINFRYCDNGASGSTTFLIIGVVGNNNSYYSFDFTSKANVNLLDIVDLAPYPVEYQRFTVGLSYVECQDVVFKCEMMQPYFYNDEECNSYWPTYPHQDPISWFPPPVWAFGEVCASQELVSMDNFPSRVPEPKKISSTMTLYYINGYQNYIMQSSQLPTCKIHLNTQYVFADLATLPTPVQLSAEPPNCNSTLLTEYTNDMQRVIQNLTTATELQLGCQYRYYLSLYASLGTWYNCLEQIQSLLDHQLTTAEQISTDCNYTVGTAEFKADPCCYGPAEFSSNCVARPITTTSLVYSNPNSTALEKACYSGTCAQSKLTQYIQNKAFVDAPYGCSAYYDPIFALPAIANNAQEDFYGCWLSYFGANGDAVTCSSDVQCPPGTVCSYITGSCVGNLTDTMNNFWECLTSALPLPAFEFIQTEFNISESNFSSPGFRDSVFQIISMQDCVTDYSLDFTKRVNWQNIPFDPQCTDYCGGIQYETSYDWVTIPECTFSVWNPCVRQLAAPSGSPANCSQLDLHCNWIACDQLGYNATTCEAECNSQPNFCGYCVGSECINIPVVSSSACTATTICALPNATLTFNQTSEQQCNSLGSCSLPQYTSEQQCTGKGTCSDASLYTSDVCVFPLLINEELHVYCNRSTSQVTFAGCPDYTVASKAECDSISGGSWYTLATTEEECLAKVGCEEYIYAFIAYSWKDAAACTQVNGVPRNYFHWTPAVWGTGKYVQSGEWRNTNYGSKYRLDQTLDWFTFQTQTYGGEILSKITELKTFSLCYYSDTINLVEALNCDCISHLDSCPSTNSSQVGLSQVCFGESTSIPIPPAHLHFEMDSFNYLPSGSSLDPENYQCTSFDVNVRSAQLYSAIQVFSFSSQVIKSSSFNSYESVINQRGSLVGQLVGNGIAIDIQLNKTRALSLNYFDICIDYLANIPITNGDFNVQDFGVLNSDGKITPLEVELASNNFTNSSTSMVCGRVKISQFTPSTFYFPILRIGGDWNNFVTSKAFAKADQVVCYIVGIVYVALAVFVLVNIAMIKTIPGMFLPRRFLLALFVLLNIARAIYYFITPSGTVDENSIGEVVLSELPTFFFFSAFSILVSIWASIAHSSTSRSNTSIYRNACIAGNVLVYIVFIVLLILYARLPSPTYTTDNVCSNSVKTLISTYHLVSWRLVIAYKFFIFGVGLILGITFAIYSYVVINKIQGFMAKAKEYERKLFMVGLVGTIAFISHTVLVIITSFDKQEATVAVLFLLIEGIPQVFITYTYALKNQMAKKRSENETSMVTVALQNTGSTTDANTTANDDTMSTTDTTSANV